MERFTCAELRPAPSPAVMVSCACVLRASPRGVCVFLGSPSGSDLVLLSKVFVVRYYRVSCLYYGRGGSGSYPRLVLRESQPIRDRRPIPERGTSETA